MHRPNSSTPRSETHDSSDRLLASRGPEKAEPRRRSSLGAMRWLLGISLVSVFAAAIAPVSSAQPTIEGFSPSSAAPGTVVTIDGAGFDPDPEARMVFVHDPASGSGAMIDSTVATDSQLVGTLGAVAEPFVGTPSVWSGTSWRVPGGLHRGQLATYLVRSAVWFVPDSTAVAPQAMAITDGSPGALAAAPAAAKLIFRLEDWVEDPIDTSIDLDILVDGGHSTGSTTTTDPTGGEPPGRIIRTDIAIVEGHLGIDASLMAGDLAMVLQATYGALGLHAEAVGSELHLSWEGAPTLASGFAVLRGND